MDLKGSLIDTKLKIFPSEELINFLKTIPDSVKVPAHIASIIENSNINIESTCLDQIQLTRSDFDKLSKINDVITKLHPEKESSQQPSETEEKNEAEKDIEENSKKNDTENIPDDSTHEEEIRQFLTTSDLTWLYIYIKSERQMGKSVPYLHELLEKTEVKLPDNEVIKRNPDLESRCVKLRSQQEAREYRKMTKGVDNVRMRFPEDSISYQLKQVNRHLIAIGQFILSIFAGFLFGFRGVEWMVGNLDFGFRLLLGVMCALVIALAEIYFLAKKLNEELSIPETVQLGGPAKFVNELNHNSTTTKQVLEKQHQD